jgi:AcrR family transcriptional regulator
MYERILEAAVRVLGEEGALGFTTTRVADEAGISVGSLYQYFPNKHAIVLAVHDADMRAGWQHIESILDRPRWSARRKVRELAEWFFVTEAEEAATLGAATGDIEVFLRGASTSIDAELAAAALGRFSSFIAAASDRRRSTHELEFDARFLMTTLEAIGKGVAVQQLPRDQTIAWARRTATMAADHLGFP